MRSLALNARSLPVYNPDGGVANITQGDSHVFTETRPYSDGYYYLLIDTEGETGIDITIHTKGKQMFLFSIMKQCFISSLEFFKISHITR